jgi:tetratricopeptide (TPR) repeat protein
VARWIEDTVGERRMEFVELLAHHFVEAHRGAAEGPRIVTSRRGVAERSQPVVDVVEELRSKAFEYLLLASEDARRKLVLAKAQRLAEQALTLATEALERCRAFEALAEAYITDYQGDLAWKNFTAAVDVRLEALPEDRAAIAWLCSRAVEVPTRWPGSMTDVPSEAEVIRYLDTGFAHAEKGDSPVLVRLLTNRSFWSFAFQRDRPLSDEEVRQAVEAGERAVEMALRLKRPALASAALDGLGGTYFVQGMGAKPVELAKRRLELVPELEDPWELGDIHAVAGWTHFHVGRYRDSFRYADEGVQKTPPDAPGMILHCMAWRALARFRLGDWDGFFADLARSQELMGERASEPLYFAARPFAAAALVHEVQGNTAAADRFFDLIQRIDERQGAAKATDRDPWIAWALARRGKLEEARARLWQPLMERWKAALPVIMEARCDVLGDMEAWDEVPGFLEDARRYADEAGLVALRSFADRLEGRAAHAAQRRLVAENMLERAAEGFASLEARWEEARTRLYLAEALLTARRIAEAREELEKAWPVFQRLQSARELSRCRELLAAEGLSI